jgi:hypothetical protein
VFSLGIRQVDYLSTFRHENSLWLKPNEEHWLVKKGMVDISVYDTEELQTNHKESTKKRNCRRIAVVKN